MLGQDFRLVRPVAVLRYLFLRGIGEQVVQVCLGIRRRLGIGDVGVDPGHRRLGQDADRRVDEFQLVLVGGDFANRLVLPGQLHVTDLW